MQKFITMSLVGAIIALLSICSVLYIQNLKYEKRIIEAEATISTQNRAIEQQKLDLAAFVEQAPKVEKQIEVKYEKIPVRNESCEAELNAIQNLVDLFYNHQTGGVR